MEPKPSMWALALAICIIIGERMAKVITFVALLALVCFALLFRAT